ncbi:MAG TPA: TonB-dependent receptor plug domain-containing protein, partial [Chitinophagaceae bacterium]|nr:TonB-dependent receptor plug domain-containing protein [Chitinophagaceae bacterium]
MLSLIAICFLNISLAAQDTSSVIKGVVTNQFGQALPDVLVNSENGRNGTSTLVGGAFSITVDDNSKALVFSKHGFLTQKVAVGDNSQLNVSLQPDVHNNDEVVQLGYTSQLREAISGAVSTVSGKELERSPVANLTQAFAGRLSGLTTQETYSELSRATTNLYIRGLSSYRDNHPLVVIDGIMVAYNPAQTLDYISANEITSVSVLKDASTEALYGIQGANGVIVITTKRGQKGKLQVHARYDQSVQQATTTPMFYNSATYAAMRNQAAFNDDPANGKNQYFSDEQIRGYQSGANKELYPNNNWYNMFMRDLATMERVGIDLNGGNDNVQFYSNLNVMHQGGLFNTDQTKYNPNSNDLWINYRSNVDIRINRYLKAYVRLSGNIKRERTPGESNSSIYQSIFQIPSNVYGPITPQILDASGEIVSPGGGV